MSTDVKPSLALKRRLKAPPAQVFQAWTVPEKMTRWWGANTEASRTAEADVRVGGRFHVGFKGDNGEQHDVSGTYREVVADRKLVFTWAWDEEGATHQSGHESLVTITFRAIGRRTEMTMRHERFEATASRDSHNQGWTGSFDKLVDMLAGKPGRA